MADISPLSNFKNITDTVAAILRWTTFGARVCAVVIMMWSRSIKVLWVLTLDQLQVSLSCQS